MPDESTLSLAQQAYNRGDFARAESLVFQETEKSSELFFLQLNLAKQAVKTGQVDNWLTPLQEIQLYAPYLSEATLILAQCHMLKGNLPQASQLFHQALSVEFATHGLKQKNQKALNKSSPYQDPNIALQTLWQTLALLKNNNLPAFATAGTLLGLERSGSLLAKDKDVDIGIYWQDMEATIKVLVANGWQEVRHSYGLCNPRCFINKDKITLDVCGYAQREETSQILSGFWMDKIPFEWNRITLYPELKLEERDSPAGTIWHLAQPEIILKGLYGETWQTEDKDFDSIVGARNLHSFSWLVQCYAYARLYSCLQDGKLSKALRIVLEILHHKPNDTLIQQLKKQLEDATKKDRINVEPVRVLAMGYFDLIHYGHLNYLRQAKQYGTHLVVAIAQDSFCQTNKGYCPILNEQDRMKMVAAIKEVDEVLLVEVTTAKTEESADWIQTLNVKKLICGQEWQGSERWNKLEASLAKRGIETVYVPRTEGISTSEIKESIIQRHDEQK